MKKLGFGLMRLPLTDANDAGTIDIAKFKELADVFISRGFTYFDTAYPYHSGQSEKAFRRAVVERYPRTAFTITDKMPIWLLEKKEDMQRIFDEQLNRCGIEYFDYYLVHSVGSVSMPLIDKLDPFAFVAEKQKEGKIKHIGFSFHDKADLLEQILKTHPEFEYVQLQVNYLDWDSPSIEARKCCEVASKYGKKIIVMEPVKGGILAEIPAEANKILASVNPMATPASWAIRFAASQKDVFMVLSGMSNIEQVLDNTSFMENFKPLVSKELDAVIAAKTIIERGITVPCTGCRYCVDGCPNNIPIPDYFAIFNNAKQFGTSINTTVYYGNLSRNHGRASDCAECGKCESVCPQHIKIRQFLKEVAATFDVAQ